MRTQKVWATSSTVIAIVLAVALLFLVNYLGARHYVRADWTRSKIYSLSDKTVNVLTALKEPVQVVVFMTPGSPLFEQTKELLERYRAKSAKVTVEYIDPDRNPLRTRTLVDQYGVAKHRSVRLRRAQEVRDLRPTRRLRLLGRAVRPVAADDRLQGRGAVHLGDRRGGQPEGRRSTSPPATARRVPEANGQGGRILIERAREHNLKDISLAIPRDRIVVVTGPSGSGKSTLAFDILFAEGQRRFLESLSVYARQYIQPMAKPDVDRIEGVPPTVDVEQKLSRGGRRSTVATLTEIYHYLRLLFAKIGAAHCTDCGRRLASQKAEGIHQDIRSHFWNKAIYLLAPLLKGKKGHHREFLRKLGQMGYASVRLDGEMPGYFVGEAREGYCGCAGPGRVH